VRVQPGVVRYERCECSLVVVSIRYDRCGLSRTVADWSVLMRCLNEINSWKQRSPLVISILIRDKRVGLVMFRD